MKGVLIVVLLGLAGAFLVVLVCIVKAWRAWRWLRALRTARWEPYTVLTPGSAQVVVRKVARSGRRQEVLQTEEMDQVDTADPYSVELVEAQGAAAAKADAYNAIERASAQS